MPTLFKDLQSNCTFALADGSLCVKLPRPISVAYSHKSRNPSIYNAILLHPDGGDLLSVSGHEQIEADVLSKHPDVEAVLAQAPHTGSRRHLRLVLPVLVENRQYANAVLLCAPVAFISV